MSDGRRYRLTRGCLWAVQVRLAAAWLAVPLAATLLAGCSSVGDAVNPANWWHSLEGGRIAEERPPPPNADAPYPSLGTVPARPEITDAATRARIASGLVADRANAQYGGSAGPDPSLPTRAPQAFGIGTAPPPAVPPATSDNPSATLQAANAPPRPPATAPTPPKPAPLGTVAQEPLAAPAAAPAVDAATVPIPAAPPPAPHIAGVDVPSITAPTPPPVAPPVVKTTSSVIPAPVLVAFQPGSSELSPEAQNALRTLAQHRGTATLEAIGYGDAPAGDPAGQAAALPLALARARAIAAALAASGVPSALVHIDAEAEGRGGAARLAD